MIIVKPNDLKPGDKVRLYEEGREYTIETAGCHSFDGALFHVAFKNPGPGSVTMTTGTPVYATQMYRTVEVPCLVHKGNMTLLHNMASGATPHGVVCGECDRRVTEVVMRRLAEEGDG